MDYYVEDSKSKILIATRSFVDKVIKDFLVKGSGSVLMRLAVEHKPVVGLKSCCEKVALRPCTLDYKCSAVLKPRYVQCSIFLLKTILIFSD